MGKFFELPDILPTSISSLAAAVGVSDELVRADHIHNFDSTDFYAENDLSLTDHEIDFYHLWDLEDPAPKIIGSHRGPTGSANRLFKTQADGKMSWGLDGGPLDTFLERTAAGELQISGSGALRLSSDVQISRISANILGLESGDSFDIIFGSLVFGGTKIITSNRLLRAADGTVGFPAYSFDGDLDTGIFLESVGKMHFSSGGISVVFINKTGLSIVGGQELKFYDIGNSNYVGFTAPSLSSNQIWVLPNVDGNAGDVLSTNGVGRLQWVPN